MALIVLLNKPFLTLSQFRDKDGRPTLADLLRRPDIHPAGRLDHDSEGLLLLTDDGSLQARIADPRWKLPKTYWAQVEGEITTEALETLRRGVVLNDGLTRPAEAVRLSEPSLWDREPPIRYRAAIPTSWISLTLREGRNRQVRRMTAAVGFPTLRLVRVAIGPWRLDGLQPGEFRELNLSPEELVRLFGPEREPKARSKADAGLRTASDQRPRRRSLSPRPSGPGRPPTPSSRKGRGS